MSWREASLVRFGPGLFAGITLGRWLRILRENHFAVDRPYWGRAAAITVGSLSNTLVAASENYVYGRKIRIGFEALEAAPIGQVRGIYEALALPDFGHVEPALRGYLDTIAGYKKNILPDLPTDVRSRVASEWRKCFDEWGYPI